MKKKIAPGLAAALKAQKEAQDVVILASNALDVARQNKVAADVAVKGARIAADGDLPKCHVEDYRKGNILAVIDGRTPKEYRVRYIGETNVIRFRETYPGNWCEYPTPNWPSRPLMLRLSEGSL